MSKHNTLTYSINNIYIYITMYIDLANWLTDSYVHKLCELNDNNITYN